MEDELHKSIELFLHGLFVALDDAGIHDGQPSIDGVGHTERCEGNSDSCIHSVVMIVWESQRDGRRFHLVTEQGIGDEVLRRGIQQDDSLSEVVVEQRLFCCAECDVIIHRLSIGVTQSLGGDSQRTVDCFGESAEL